MEGEYIVSRPERPPQSAVSLNQGYSNPNHDKISDFPPNLSTVPMFSLKWPFRPLFGGVPLYPNPTRTVGPLQIGL